MLFAAPLALLVGCGDNVPARPDGAGGGGGGGAGGAAGASDAGGSGGGDGGAGRGGSGGGGSGGDAGPETGGDAGGSGGAAGDAGTEMPTPCYTVAFLSPSDGTMLNAGNDKSGDNCADGFQLDVQISTSAPDFTDVSLFGGNALLKSTQVSAGRATFTNVQIASTGNTQLSIQFPSTAACTDPTTRATVSVDCHVPACTVSKPVISASHPVLNGVPAPAGDRVNAPGSPTYQAAFEVTTDIEDGQSVSLLIDNAASPSTVTTVTAMATGGKATFAGVTLSPDGQYEVQATCTALNGVVGRSMRGTYPVDTTPPNLTVSRPADGAFFGPTDLTAGKFQVCGKTDNHDNDAVSLPAALGAAANNFCVTVGGSKSCVPVTAADTDTCVDVTCAGGAPFDITVDLNDAGSNVTSATIHGVACASSLPSVQIIAPVSDAPTFTDKSKHLLAATAAQAFRDQSAGTAGAQTDVVACADRAGSAALLVGHADGSSLSQLGASVNTAPAVLADGCPAGFGFVARFSGVTLPDSNENTDGSLAAGGATRLRVNLTDISTATGSSPPIDIWVDPGVPLIALQSPANLCGSFHQAATTFVTAVSFNSDTADVTLTVTNGASTDTLTNPTFDGVNDVATFSTVTFDQGQSSVAATAADKAGNTTALLPSPCTVIVGMAPVVVFTTPTAANKLCPATGVAANCIDDADAIAGGWQGNLAVNVTGGGAPITSGTVTFLIGNTTLGPPVALDASGNAQLSNVTLLDGTVTITAQTSDIPNRGVGTGTVTVIVDTGPPNAPTGLVPSVSDRRSSSFRLDWVAPDDNGATVAGYEVRAARVPITAANFDDATVTKAFPFSGSPATPGQPDSIIVAKLNIETDYFFAVAAVDATGTRSAITATAAPIQAQFQLTILSGTGTDGVGVDVNGVGDFGTAGSLSFTGDGFSDLIVGATGGKHVYVFFGTASGYSATPSITFTGAATGFGQAVADAGDLDGDGLDDIAIASPADGAGKVYIFSRKNPPASWGTTTAWPAALLDTQANYVLTLDATFAGLATNSIPSRGLGRLRNFDGTGTDDLAIGVVGHAARLGAVLIAKGSSSFGSTALPDPLGQATIEIDGTIANGSFGAAVMGIGQFFPSPAGRALVATAPIVSAAYAFAGQAPAGVLTTANADDSVIAAAADRYGINLGFLGPVGASPDAITIGSTTGKYVDVHLGTAATGPLLGPAGGAPAASVRFVDVLSANSFGILNIGCGVKGASQTVSILGGFGDTVPELILAGQSELNTPIYIINGAALPSLSGTVDVSAAQVGPVPSIVKIPGRVPTPWSGYSGAGIIIDSNKDGYADFVIGEADFGKPGRVVVFY